MKFYSFVLRILSRSKNLTQIKGHNSVTALRKLMCNNPNLDLAIVSIQNLVVLKILSRNEIMIEGQNNEMEDRWNYDRQTNMKPHFQSRAIKRLSMKTL